MNRVSKDYVYIKEVGLAAIYRNMVSDLYTDLFLQVAIYFEQLWLTKPLEEQERKIRNGVL